MADLIADEQATGKVKEVYQEIGSYFGMVPNFFRAQAAADPEWLEVNWNRWKLIMGQERGLDRKTKELIAVAVAIANNCEYCTLAHEASALTAGANHSDIIEMKQVVELFSSFTKIAASLKVPCDISPDILNKAD